MSAYQAHRVDLAARAETRPALDEIELDHNGRPESGKVVLLLDEGTAFKHLSARGLIHGYVRPSLQLVRCPGALVAKEQRDARIGLDSPSTQETQALMRLARTLTPPG